MSTPSRGDGDALDWAKTGIPVIGGAIVVLLLMSKLRGDQSGKSGDQSGKSGKSGKSGSGASSQSTSSQSASSKSPQKGYRKSSSDDEKKKKPCP
ncbi:corneodesmosin-like [Hyposmocoma kahamanoa]|uniref:corneodesmosin-like n=1 Tax=Hyposmocoma kahamanoa TaxID=1477025 RepID=UPI000E6D7628|nr:corneodesmosin-like [Hyposmocoma kahamanoa]